MSEKAVRNGGRGRGGEGWGGGGWKVDRTTERQVHGPSLFILTSFQRLFYIYTISGEG